MNAYRNGAVIALAVGGLLGGCKKDSTSGSSTQDKPAPTTPAAPGSAAPAPGSAAPAPGSAAVAPGSAAAGEKVAKVHCTGINDCSGKGACKTAKNDCTGKNTCKGLGFVDVPEQECKDKGGTIATNVGM